MKRKYLGIGISIIAVILLTLTSLSNVVGYQTVNSSFQIVKNNDDDSRERIFHTISVLANNYDVQTVLFEFNKKSAMISMIDFPFVLPHVITDQDLNLAYDIGLLLIRVIGKSRLISVLNQTVMMNGGMEKVLSAVIDQNASLRAEVSGLADLTSTCECDESLWVIPPNGICFMLFIFGILINFLFAISAGLDYLFYDLYHITTPFLFVFLVCYFLSQVFYRFAKIFVEISEIQHYLFWHEFECITQWPWPP
jgi:hypothetical protein